MSKVPKMDKKSELKDLEMDQEKKQGKKTSLNLVKVMAKVAFVILAAVAIVTISWLLQSRFLDPSARSIEVRLESLETNFSELKADHDRLKENVTLNQEKIKSLTSRMEELEKLKKLTLNHRSMDERLKMTNSEVRKAKGELSRLSQKFQQANVRDNYARRMAHNSGVKLLGGNPCWIQMLLVVCVMFTF